MHYGAGNMIWDEENEHYMFENIMDDFRDIVLEKLSQIELAALFGDLGEFIYYYKQDLEKKKVEHRLN